MSYNQYSNRCQICSADISRCKLYYVRNSICEHHSKAPTCLVEGETQRWCQQCCKFQDLCDFDGERRTCRWRLALHNARRKRRLGSPPFVFEAEAASEDKQETTTERYGVGQRSIHRSAAAAAAAAAYPTPSPYEDPNITYTSSGRARRVKAPPTLAPDFPTAAAKKRCRRKSSNNKALSQSWYTGSHETGSHENSTSVAPPAGAGSQGELVNTMPRPPSFYGFQQYPGAPSPQPPYNANTSKMYYNGGHMDVMQGPPRGGFGGAGSSAGGGSSLPLDMWNVNPNNRTIGFDEINTAMNTNSNPMNSLTALSTDALNLAAAMALGSTAGGGNDLLAVADATELLSIANELGLLCEETTQGAGRAPAHAHAVAGGSGSGPWFPNNNNNAPATVNGVNGTGNGVPEALLEALFAPFKGAVNAAAVNGPQTQQQQQQNVNVRYNGQQSVQKPGFQNLWADIKGATTSPVEPSNPVSRSNTNASNTSAATAHDSSFPAWKVPPMLDAALRSALQAGGLEGEYDLAHVFD